MASAPRLGLALAWLPLLACGSSHARVVDASVVTPDASLGDASEDGATWDAGAAAMLDPDGVEMLLPSAPGSSFRLGKQDANRTTNLTIENHDVATPVMEGALAFWHLVAYDFSYASGGTGKTSRLDIHASGGVQNFTWKTQHGYLSSPTDVRNQEFTVYVRPHDIFDAARAAVTMKIRGGAHTTDGDLASCVMLTLSPGGRGFVTRFGKELVHPNYDYVTLPPRFDAALVDGQWVGIKMLSYAVPGDATRVMNQLWLDTAPFDPATGRPLNHWRQLSEYIDVEGASTGMYTKLVDWGAWQTTVRTDGMTTVDFALLSLREITPPQ